MSDFFKPPMSPPVETEQRYRQPEWLAAPYGSLPGVVALELVLARSDRAAVCVSHLGAYSTGFEIELLTLTPVERDDLDPLLFGPHRRTGAQGDALPPEMLRFGVQFADGAKATNTGGLPTHDPSSLPTGPIIVPRGGGGGGGSWQQSLWVWPLPPPGPLQLVCEWPAAQIELTRHQLDASALIDAAARARTIFTDEHLPEPPGH
jgi:hypothetical protein